MKGICRACQLFLDQSEQLWALQPVKLFTPLCGFSTLSLAFPEPVDCQSLRAVMASGASAAQDESPASINSTEYGRPSNVPATSLQPLRSRNHQQHEQWHTETSNPSLSFPADPSPWNQRQHCIPSKTFPMRSNTRSGPTHASKKLEIMRAYSKSRKTLWTK